MDDIMTFYEKVVLHKVQLVWIVLKAPVRLHYPLYKSPFSGQVLGKSMALFSAW